MGLHTFSLTHQIQIKPSQHKNLPCTRKRRNPALPCQQTKPSLKVAAMVDVDIPIGEFPLLLHGHGQLSVWDNCCDTIQIRLSRTMC